jgi:hypothetical protein
MPAHAPMEPSFGKSLPTPGKSNVKGALKFRTGNDREILPHLTKEILSVKRFSTRTYKIVNRI